MFDGEDTKALVDAVREAFSDVIGDRQEQLIVQVKHEEWGGDFVDLGLGGVPDRSVVKAVLVPCDQPRPGISHIMEVSGKFHAFC